MDNETLRNVVADMLTEVRHSNTEFIRQIRAGEQDDGVFMRTAMAVNAAWLAKWQPAPEVLED